ncbi:hypothetical protein D917_06704 [Trichinella nativa]|uniref:Uncharacterized protein n=1 Tax=Trichinella nativa TaxID=6335 RepID=A0A1Y3ESH9_9BILA|nr:hypothetical protein D917_06704 [Trichinella nativa]
MRMLLRFVFGRGAAYNPIILALDCCLNKRIEHSSLI